MNSNMCLDCFVIEYLLNAVKWQEDKVGWYNLSQTAFLSSYGFKNSVIPNFVYQLKF